MRFTAVTENISLSTGFDIDLAFDRLRVYDFITK